MIPRAFNSIQQNGRFWDWLRTTLAGSFGNLYRTIDAIESQSMAAPRIQWSVACPPCCARAASGHAAAPPSSVMKSRRLLSNMEVPAPWVTARIGHGTAGPCGRLDQFGIVPERPGLLEVIISHPPGVDSRLVPFGSAWPKQQTVVKAVAG